ncbi:MAG: hypothetical protein ACYCUX_05550, partial [Metallibacterium sp.]
RFFAKSTPMVIVLIETSPSADGCKNHHGPRGRWKREVSFYSQTETGNIELYMEELGYTNFGSSIESMSNAEFNSFLDAITFAEGRTNMSC